MSDVSSPSAGEKICCSCGENVAGKKRLKDDAGQYWCIPCAEREDQKRHGGKLQCPDCHRFLREDAMIAVELTKVCPTCYRERQEMAKKNPVIRNARYDAEYRKHEMKKIKSLALFALGLVALALWQFDLLPWSSAQQSELRQLMTTAMMLGIVTLAFLIGGIMWVRKNF
jgi:hypothetical protein